MQVALAAALVPFVITGLLRLSYAIPTWVPFALIAMVGISLLGKARRRPVGIGLLIGTIAWEVVIFLLLAGVGAGLDKVG